MKFYHNPLREMPYISVSLKPNLMAKQFLVNFKVKLINMQEFRGSIFIHLMSYTDYNSIHNQEYN